jgi:hypothetical protein
MARDKKRQRAPTRRQTHPRRKTRRQARHNKRRNPRAAQPQRKEAVAPTPEPPHAAQPSNITPGRPRGSSFPMLSERLRVAYATQLPGCARHVLAYVCWRVDATTGETYVGLPKMARELGLPLRTLKVRLALLVEKGWVSRIRRPNKSSLTVLRSDFFQRPAGDVDPVTEAPQRRGNSCPTGGAIAAQPEGQPLHPGGAIAAPREGNSRLSNSMTFQRAAANKAVLRRVGRSASGLLSGIISGKQSSGSARAAAAPSERAATGRPRLTGKNERGPGACSSEGAAPAAAAASEEDRRTSPSSYQQSEQIKHPAGESPPRNLPTLCRIEDARGILKAGRPQLLEKYKGLPTYEDMVRRAVAPGLDSEDMLWVRVPSKPVGREDWKQLEREWGEILRCTVCLLPTEERK